MVECNFKRVVLGVFERKTKLATRSTSHNFALIYEFVAASNNMESLYNTRRKFDLTMKSIKLNGTCKVSKIVS